jgi:hypothetical protein
MPALATATATRELRQLLEPFTRSASTATERELRIDRIDLDGAVMRAWPIENGRYEQRSNGDIVEIQPMLQATRSFVADYDGDRVQVDRNTRVAINHAIARAHPDWFEPADDLVADSVRTRSATPPRQATRPKPRPARATISPASELPKYKVELRDTRSRAAVTIGEFAHDVIQKECLRMAPFGNLETGGLIAARTARSWDTRVYVVDARGPGPRSEHKPNELRIDLTGDTQLERDFAYAEADIGEAGQWHTHPSGATKPSPTDLDTWADALRLRQRPPRQRRVHRPNRHPWLARIVALTAADRLRRAARRERIPRLRVRAVRRVSPVGHRRWVVSIRRETTDMVAITSFWASETNLVRAGTVLAAKDPIVRRCRSFFTEAALMPALDPDAMRAAERRLWAQMTASDV